MKMMTTREFLLVAAIFTIAACAQLGLPTAQTFDQKLTAGYATAEGINRSATTLLNAKKLSSADGQHVLDQTRNLRAGLDVARAMHKSDPKSADSKVDAMRAALTAVQAYLTSKEK